MFAPYRLGYLAVASVLIGGIVVVSAETEPEQQAPQTAAPAKPATEETKPVIKDVSSEYEKGNLSEVGAREILTISDYERAVTISKAKPVLVYKHSTQCEVNGASYRRLAAWLKEKGKDAPAIFLVKVIETRPVSLEIEARTGIKHESPQVILFVDAKPVWNTDHAKITGEAIDVALRANPLPAKQTD